MWTSYQFIIILMCTSVLTTYRSANLPQFAVYSELTWLSVFMLSAVCGASIDDPFLLSSPFIVLVLTGVEAVVIWTLLVYSFKLKL